MRQVQFLLLDKMFLLNRVNYFLFHFQKVTGEIEENSTESTFTTKTGDKKYTLDMN